jgi:predicted membrane-bound spermidine synthase
MDPSTSVNRSTYAGLFMVSLATLMYEILLTRIFSVTIIYHFAFMAVSLALYGMSVGAIIVYLMRNLFTQADVKRLLSASALSFAVAIVVSMILYINIPLRREHILLPLLANFVVISIPFIFSGISVSLALTRFPKHVDRLYAADLVGASLGCIALIYVLKYTDGLTAVLITAGFAGLGAYFFARGSNRDRLLHVTTATSVLLIGFSIFHTYLVQQQAPLLRLKWVKGEREPAPLVEKWNSFSRVRVWKNPLFDEIPFGWGLSEAYSNNIRTNQLYMDIDASAATILTAFDGDLKKVDYLKYDLTNLVHYLRPASNVLVVGLGGGRDVLSALAFNQKSVVGVEVNENIIDLVTRKYGDFTGHLDQYPNVSFVNDEARSYLTRSKDVYDIIHVSLIDTWAATTAGAFVLTENSLYTMEAWNTFYHHLSADGILSFSRWYFRDQPGEMYRLTALAVSTLRQAGVRTPRENILIVRYLPKNGESDSADGIGTLLLSKAPFSSKTLQEFRNIVSTMDFEVVLSPEEALDPIFAEIASTPDPRSFYNSFSLNITPPTDDSPYFFNMLRLRDIGFRSRWQQGAMTPNMVAVYILGSLFIIVSLLTVLCIVIPLILTSRKVDFSGTTPLFSYFLAIGIGFMLVEISQMQRLTVFLGQPTYSLSVVLFSLLLSSGLGSYLTKGISTHNLQQALIRLGLLFGVLVLFGKLTPWVIARFFASVTFIRILTSVGILFPLGLFMGMAFPLGMKLASFRVAAITPWLWGMNGAASVLSSVLATAIALTFSISASFWCGVACYAIALATYAWSVSRQPESMRVNVFSQL